MANYSTKQTRPKVSQAARTTGHVIPTYERGRGFERDTKTELFLLAASLLMGEGSFYEAADDQAARFRALVQDVVAEDPDWVARFIPYLRSTLLIRTASVAAACEYVAAKGPNGRAVVNSALQRGDEPAEALAYWLQTYGRKIPAALKRGVADAAVRLYTDWAVVRYDGQGRAWRMGDVLNLTHPKPKNADQAALFKFLLDQRHHNDGERALPTTWEKSNPSTAADWEKLIRDGSLGYMSLLRNLRNFDEKGVSDDVADIVVAKLANPDEVRKSRQFPLRFLSAYQNTHSDRWQRALSRALDVAVENVPRLPGRTLVLIDTSGSMDWNMSDRSQMRRADVATLFGLALAKRCESVDVVSYSDRSMPFALAPGSSILRAMKDFPFIGQGTYTWAAARAHYNRHDRVVILTDEQAHDSDDGVIKAPVYTFNLVGYRAGHHDLTSNRFVFGGLTDAAFTLLKVLDECKDEQWPF